MAALLGPSSAATCHKAWLFCTQEARVELPCSWALWQVATEEATQQPPSTIDCSTYKVNHGSKEIGAL